MSASDDVREGLERWEREGLISADQRTAIETFESERESAASDQPLGGPDLAELLVYAGVAVVVGGLFAMGGEVWDDLGLAGRFAWMLGLAVVTGVAGILVRRSESPPADRAASVLWFASSGLVAAAMVSLLASIEPNEDRFGVIVIGAPTVAVSLAYYLVERRRVLQLIALIGSGLLFAFGVPLTASGDIINPHSGAALAVIYAGIVVVLAERKVLQPRELAQALGAVIAIGGLLAAGGTDRGNWAEATGFFASIGWLGWALSRESIPQLVVGVLGLVAFVIEFVVKHLEDSVGGATVILIIGAALVGLALAVTRMRSASPASQSPPDAQPPLE